MDYDDTTKAAYAFVDSMIPKAEAKGPGQFGYLWHGWALREAFEAGAKYEREAGAVYRQEPPRNSNTA